MRTTRLGKTDLQVSTLALGTWAYGGDWGAFDADEATQTIRLAVEQGINLFDTAQAYGFGVSERHLGEALWGVARRDEVVVATKGGLRPDGNVLVRDASPEWLRSGVESSLRNLETEYIDLYQVHWPDQHTPPEETAQALAAMVSEGKVRHVGVSNYDTKQIDELARFIPVETLQPPYHMFHRDIEDEILPYAGEYDIGVLVYGPLAHGILAGQMTPTTAFPDGDWRAHSADFAGERFSRNLEVVERLRAFAEDRGLSLPVVAVAWAISSPIIDVAIVGARRPSQLSAILPSGDAVLSETDLREIDAILADSVRVAGPSPEGM